MAEAKETLVAGHGEPEAEKSESLHPLLELTATRVRELIGGLEPSRVLESA